MSQVILLIMKDFTVFFTKLNEMRFTNFTVRSRSFGVFSRSNHGFSRYNFCQAHSHFLVRKGSAITHRILPCCFTAQKVSHEPIKDSSGPIGQRYLPKQSHRITTKKYSWFPNDSQFLKQKLKRMISTHAAPRLRPRCPATRWLQVFESGRYLSTAGTCA